MKKGIFIFYGLFFLNVLLVKSINNEEAREILQSRFVSLIEIKDLYPGAPDSLEIPFSKEFLERNKSAWLIPVKIDSNFKYLLVRANFENEFCALKNIDTLDLKMATEVITLIKKLRPWFPGRVESNLAFKYFFRTDEIYLQDKPEYKKAISYDGKNFIVVAWPDNIELGVMNKNCISYLTRNKKGAEIQFETTPLPDNHPKVTEQQSVLVLTLFSCRE